MLIRNLCPFICVILMVGCGTMTKVGTTTASSIVGAAVAGPAGAVGGALIGDTIGELVIDPILELREKAQTVTKVVEKVDGFWPLLAKAVEAGAWIFGLFLLIPLVLGFVIPAPKFGRRQTDSAPRRPVKRKRAK
jgi:hypothetical protein